MNDFKNVKTGDVILFSGNATGGFIVKTFVSSMWNHVGIAVRLINIPTDSNPHKKKISLTEEGDLYIYETNTYTRWDDFLQQHSNGPGFTKSEFIFGKYNLIAVRKLNDIFRTERFAELVLEFSHAKKNQNFPKSGLPFLAVWLGIPMKSSNCNMDTEMFCSELTATFYAKCVGPLYESIIGAPFDGNPSTLFGRGSPTTSDTYTPGHYSYANTPNSCIFSGKEEIIYKKHSSLFCTIWKPIIILIFLAIIIYITLPKHIHSTVNS